MLSEVSLHAPRSSCKTSHNTQSVKTFQLSGGRENDSSLCSLYTHYCTTHCAHMHPPTIYATLLCMHNQQTNRVFPSPRLGHVLHNSRQLGRNSGPPPQDSGVCMKCGYYLTTTHPFPNKTTLSLSHISCIPSVHRRTDQEEGKVEQYYPFSPFFSNRSPAGISLSWRWGRRRIAAASSGFHQLWWVNGCPLRHGSVCLTSVFP